MNERLPQIHNSDRKELRQCYTQPGQEPRPKLFDFGNLSPESQAIYDASRAGSRLDHLIDNVTNAFGQTALHLADDLGLIDALPRFGVKQDIVDDFGNTPMQAARERGDAATALVMKRHRGLGPGSSL